MKPNIGQFEIHEPFIITGRGLVFTGRILEGEINLGDTLRFEIDGVHYERIIMGIDNGMRVPVKRPSIGILIGCKDEEEMKKLRAWDPSKAIAEILKEK